MAGGSWTALATDTSTTLLADHNYSEGLHLQLFVTSTKVFVVEIWITLDNGSNWIRAFADLGVSTQADAAPGAAVYCYQKSYRLPSRCKVLVHNTSAGDSDGVFMATVHNQMAG